MKIRNARDRTMRLHIREAPRIRTRQIGKPKLRRAGKKLSIRKNLYTQKSAGKKQKTSGTIVMKRRSLYVMGKAGMEKSSEQMEGGEELKESAQLAALAAAPAYHGAVQVKRAYRRKKLEAGMEEKKGGNKNSDIDYGNNSTGKTLTAGEVARRKLAFHRKEDGFSGTRNKNRTKTQQRGMGRGSGDKAFASVSTEKKMQETKRARMVEAFRSGRHKNGGNRALPATFKQAAKSAALALIRKASAVMLPGLLGLFSVMAIVGITVVAVFGIVYNSPLSVFMPLPNTGYENPRTVLSSYYMEFNQKVAGIEENGDEVTYANMENGAPVSNFNDTLMVYMVLYGDGKAGFVMDEEGRRKLKKVFDEMNYIDSESMEKEIEVGDSLGMVWTTAYCPCSICCGPYANGITASGTVGKARHTIAVDAYHPIVPMGTKVVIEGITYTVEDTGDLNHYGNDFDIFYAHHEDCRQWGHRQVEAFLAEGNANTVVARSNGITVHNLTYEDYVEKNSLSAEQSAFLGEMMESGLWETFYSSEAGQAVAELAMTKIGCRYSQGRRMEEGYYDCSSLVYRLYKEAGIELPTIAADQGLYCYQNALLVNREELAPGDLIFYSYEYNGAFRNISHVAIYVGDGMMVHAANTNRGVVCDPLRDGHVVFYGRPCR